MIVVDGYLLDALCRTGRVLEWGIQPSATWKQLMGSYHDQNILDVMSDARIE